MARRVCYQVAASLDGFIAGPAGEADWIPMDPDIDFATLYSRFDTLLMGRGTWDAMVKMGGVEAIPGKQIFVFSRTLRGEDHPGGITVVPTSAVEMVAALRNAPDTGKDIWLFGGGALFASLAAAGLVDTVEVAVVPVLLGGGIRLAPSTTTIPLRFQSQRVYPKSGIVVLEYSVARDAIK